MPCVRVLPWPASACCAASTAAAIRPLHLAAQRPAQYAVHLTQTPFEILVLSSAFAKRYIDEQGSDDVLSWCERASELTLSVIAVPELVSAFCRLRREGRVNDELYSELKEHLMADIADTPICDTSRDVVRNAIAALEAHPLRAIDAIHLGAALACAADAECWRPRGNDPRASAAVRLSKR